MQCAVIEFARNVLKLEDAHTVEIKKSAANPVIAMMEEQKWETTMIGCTLLAGHIGHKPR